MSRTDSESFHNRYCANRSVGTAQLFVAFCAIVLFAGWWAALGEPHPQESGAFFLFFQAYDLFVVGVLFAAFKCVRERVVLAVSLLGPARVLLFAAVPRLRGWAGVADRVALAAWAIALVISLSMLISALRRRNRPSQTESI